MSYGVPNVFRPSWRAIDFWRSIGFRAWFTELGPFSSKAMQMPKSYSVEFRWRVLSFVRSGKSVADTASELGASTGSLHAWVNQDEIDPGQRPGLTTKEHGRCGLAQAPDR